MFGRICVFLVSENALVKKNIEHHIAVGWFFLVKDSLDPVFRTVNKYNVEILHIRRINIWLIQSEILFRPQIANYDLVANTRTVTNDHYVIRANPTHSTFWKPNVWRIHHWLRCNGNRIFEYIRWPPAPIKLIHLFCKTEALLNILLCPCVTNSDVVHSHISGMCAQMKTWKH